MLGEFIRLAAVEFCIYKKKKIILGVWFHYHQFMFPVNQYVPHGAIFS